MPRKATANRKNPCSKKHVLPKLPNSWRDDLWASSKPEQGFTHYKAALAISILTGLRPCELEKGVKVSILTSGHLCIKIWGAKTGHIQSPQGETIKRGMDYRILAFDSDFCSQVEWLIKHIGILTGDIHYARVSGRKPQNPIPSDGYYRVGAESFRAQLNLQGARYLCSQGKKHQGINITPYLFRHALGTDLKSCDELDDSTRAMIMGHMSTRSLEKYGRRRRGGGGKLPCAAVHTSDQPRIAQKSHTAFLGTRLKQVNAGYTMRF